MELQQTTPMFLKTTHFTELNTTHEHFLPLEIDKRNDKPNPDLRLSLCNPRKREILERPLSLFKPAALSPAQVNTRKQRHNPWPRTPPAPRYRSHWFQSLYDDIDDATLERERKEKNSDTEMQEKKNGETRMYKKESQPKTQRIAGEKLEKAENWKQPK